LHLPQYTEDGFFEVPTRASEARSAFWTDEDEVTGDEARQFTNPENSMGCAVVDHGRSSAETDVNLAPVKRGGRISGLDGSVSVVVVDHPGATRLLKARDNIAAVCTSDSHVDSASSEQSTAVALPETVVVAPWALRRG